MTTYHHGPAPHHKGAAKAKTRIPCINKPAHPRGPKWFWSEDVTRHRLCNECRQNTLSVFDMEATVGL